MWTAACRLLLCLLAVYGAAPVLAHDVRFAGPPPGDLRGGTASLDAKGRILVYASEPRFWDPEKREWDHAIGNSVSRRHWHTATTTSSGRIVAIGGVDVVGDFNRQQNALGSVSVWNAEAAAWEAGPSLITPRLGHTATALPDGDIVVTGGSSTVQAARAFGVYLQSVERVSANTTTQRAAMSTARAYHSASLLRDGRVLVVGGRSADGRALVSTELYDPRADRWEAGPALLLARSTHTATVLRDGSVLVVGGFDADGNAIELSEVLAPGATQWRTAGVLAAPRGEHEATLLGNDDVLISGGLQTLAIQHAGSPVLSLERRRADDGEWEPAGELPLTLRDHQALRMDNDVVLLFGSDPYGASTLAWTPDAPQAITPASTHAAQVVPLADGRFMVVGGNRRQAASGAALIYDPRENRWTATSPMHWPRTNHRALRLRDGRVLVFGGSIHGVGTDDPKTQEKRQFPAEIWDPATGRWSLSHSLKYASGSWQEPALLNDGRVMLAGVNNAEIYSVALHFFRIWDPVDDVVTAPTQVPRTRPGGHALYYADGHVLHLGGEDRATVSRDPRCYQDIEAEGDTPPIASTVDPCTLTQESAREGTRLDWWDPATKAWKELRPAQLSLNGMRMQPLEDGGVLAWSPPSASGAPRAMLAWQPQQGWRSLPMPPATEADPWFEAHALDNGELLVHTGNASWLWSAGWQSIAHEAHWGFVLGVFTRDGKTMAFRSRDSGAPGPFGALEVVTLNRAARRWELPPTRYISRRQPALAALDGGRVLVAGGELAQTQIFDPKSNSWRASAYTSAILRSATSLRLHDGNVMLVGINTTAEDKLVCELWSAHSESWQTCGEFPTNPRLSSRAPLLRYLDDDQVLLVHGEDRAMVRTAAGQWVATKLQLPRGGVPAPNADGTPFLDNLAGVWNPARNRWDDATDVLFWFRQGWTSLRTNAGDVLASSGSSFIVWRTHERTLTQPSLRDGFTSSQFDALARTADGCVLSWTNFGHMREAGMPLAAIANEAEQRWIKSNLVYELPRLAAAVELPGGELLIAGESSYSRDGVVRIRADCRGMQSTGTPQPTYLPIATAKNTPRVVNDVNARIQLAPKARLPLTHAWIATWRAHLAALLEHIKSKLVFGALLLFYVVRHCLDRWGTYPEDEEALSVARRLDIALMIASLPVALVALGIPLKSIQIPLAVVASALAAFAAARFFANGTDTRAKVVGLASLALLSLFATAVIGTYTADTLYRTLHLLTDYS